MIHSVVTPRNPVTLSEKLQARLDSHRATRAAEATKVNKKQQADPFFLSGLALGLSASIAAFTFGVNHPTNDLPPVPSLEPAATVSQAPAGIDFHAPVKPGQKCVPYASNGTYLPELCGNYDAFAAKAERTSRPNADPTACADGTCTSERAKANRDAYWAEQNRRESEKRADCRAGRIDRDTCNLLVWGWETRE
jgi:hypothetical protein